MFSCCCLPTSQGHGRRKTQSESLIRRCRRWLNPQQGRVRPFGRRKSKVTKGTRAGEADHADTVLLPEQPHHLPLPGWLSGGYQAGQRGDWGWTPAGCIMFFSRSWLAGTEGEAWGWCPSAQRLIQIYRVVISLLGGGLYL